MSIEGDLARALGELLANEAPANAVEWVSNWIAVLLRVGGQSALDIVESEAAKCERRTPEESIASRVVYGKVQCLARQAQFDFEKARAQVRLERVKELRALIDASAPRRARLGMP